MDPHAKWDEFEREKRSGLPGLPDPTLIRPNCNVLRVRKEYQARDAINARSWDNFHATPPTQTASAALTSATTPVYMDMNPINSRTNAVHYRQQPQYIPDPPRGTTTASDLGAPPLPAGISKPANTFSQNSYTQRLDAGGSDARNMMRELRGAVVEDNLERQVDSARLLAQRQFYDRWLPAQAAVDASSLQAYELLRPRQDDWRSSAIPHFGTNDKIGSESTFGPRGPTTGATVL